MEIGEIHPTSCYMRITSMFLSLASFQTIFYRATHMERLCIAYMRLWLNEQWLFVQHGCQTGCQTPLTTGLTTDCIVYTNSQPVVV